MPESSTQPNSETLNRAENWLGQYGDVLFAYAMRRLSDADDAEDAVQNTLIAAMRAAHSFRGDSTEKTWLIGILRHKVLDVLRRRSVARPISFANDDERVGQFQDGYWVNRPVKWPALPDERLRRDELRAALDRAIDALPPAMRTAFCLKEIDGVESKEICKVMNITPTNLWTLLHRARLRLRELLTDEWIEKDRA